MDDIARWWIRGDLPLMINMIQLWNEQDGDNMLNEEVWYSWYESGN